MAEIRCTFGGRRDTLDGYIVQRDDGTGYRRFSDNQEWEARDYYNSLQALDNQEKSNRLQEENLKIQQANFKVQQANTNNSRLGFNRNFPPPPPRPNYDPEYAEFLKWKKETDPEYVKFKQEKARNAAEAEQRRLEEGARKQKEQEQKAQNEKNYFEQLLKTASLGNAKSQYEVGVIFEKGTHGVGKNNNEAFKWLLKSAEQGHIDAYTNVSYMYGSIKGNYSEALKWARKALRHVEVTDTALKTACEDYIRSLEAVLYKK